MKLADEAEMTPRISDTIEKCTGMLAVAALAPEEASLSMRLVKKYVEPCSHRNSPHKFTQQQLMSGLVLLGWEAMRFEEVPDDIGRGL